MSSHASAPVTTSLLTILCVALVHRDRPDWLAIGVGDTARAAPRGPERVSRLASRVARPFADVVGNLHPPGPPDSHRGPGTRRTVTLRALPRGRHRRPGPGPAASARRRCAAGGRLAPPVHRAALAHQGRVPRKALSLPERTLRHGLAHSPVTRPTHASPPSPPPQRPARRRRFRFDVHLPSTQVGADPRTCPSSASRSWHPGPHRPGDARTWRRTAHDRGAARSDPCTGDVPLRPLVRRASRHS